MRTPEEILLTLKCIDSNGELSEDVLNGITIIVLRGWMNEIKASYEKNNLGDNQAPDCGPDGCLCADGDGDNKLK